MTDKIAAVQAGDESLVALDNAVDKMLMAMREISDMLPTVNAETPAETTAKAKMQDILDTALMPYSADFVEALTTFEGDEE